MSINSLGSSYISGYPSATHTNASSLGQSAGTGNAKAESGATASSGNGVVVNISANGKTVAAQATEQPSFKDVGTAARAKLDTLIQQAAKKAGISPQAVNVQAMGVIDYSGFSDQELAAMDLNSSNNFSVAERDKAGAVLASRVAVSLEPYRAATNAGDRRGHAMAINVLYDKMSPEIRSALGWTPVMMAANNQMLQGDEKRFGKLDISGILAQLQTAQAHGGLGASGKSASEGGTTQPGAMAQGTSISNTASSRSTSSGTGYELMVSRLFGGKETEVANGTQGMNTNNISRSPHEFLTRDDRALLADMYDYAQAQGADLTYVDRLAGELGEYRQLDNGRLSTNFNNGTNYDAQGRQLTVNFNSQDAATASRILSGTAINGTRVDQGFLRNILNPGYGALTNTSDLKFLEKMVVKFSREGSAQTSLGDGFASVKPVKQIKDNIVLSASQDTRIAPFEPDITNVNGVWTVTSKGAAAGITLDQVIGNSGRGISADSIGLAQNRYILDAMLNAEDGSASRPDWLTALLQRINSRY